MSQTPVRKRRFFDETFKREAVNHWLSSGKSAATVAAELGIHSNRLYLWKPLQWEVQFREETTLCPQA